MLKYYSFCIILCISSLSWGQVLHFKVLDGTTFRSLGNVLVTSSIVRNDTFRTNNEGFVYLNHVNGDTITFTQPFYFPIALHVKQKSNKFGDVIQIYMVPSIRQNHQPSSNNLQTFEYHFVHDSLREETPLKIHVMDYRDPNLMPQNVDKAFKITHIDIKGKAKETQYIPYKSED